MSSKTSNKVSIELTIPSGLDLDGPLWQFAGSFWSRAPAQGSALRLQERGWSVTDILCALWQASQGQLFCSFGSLQTDDASLVLGWRAQVTETLRRVRKAIPKGHPATDPARDRIARSELEAERVELALAYQALSQSPSGGVKASTDATAQQHAIKSLALKNLQAAAPENTMDHETVRLLATLTRELETFIQGDQPSC